MLPSFSYDNHGISDLAVSTKRILDSLESTLETRPARMENPNAFLQKYAEVCSKFFVFFHVVYSFSLKTGKAPQDCKVAKVVTL